MRAKKPKLTEIQKFSQWLKSEVRLYNAKSGFGLKVAMDVKPVERKLRALVKEAYLIGKHHGVMACPKKDADHYFKFKFGVKP